MFACIEDEDKLFGRVAPIHVEGKLAAILPVQVVRQASQLSPFILTGRAVAFDESQDAGYERYDAIRNKLEGTRSLREPPSVWGTSLTMKVMVFCVFHCGRR